MCPPPGVLERTPSTSDLEGEGPSPSLFPSDGRRGVVNRKDRHCTQVSYRVPGLLEGMGTVVPDQLGDRIRGQPGSLRDPPA